MDCDRHDVAQFRRYEGGPAAAALQVTAPFK
jgi:hypothetical protein